jgi:tetratricopeptide (TPR) repeat protein
VYLIVRAEDGRSLTEAELKTVRLSKTIGFVRAEIATLSPLPSGEYRRSYGQDGENEIAALDFVGDCRMRFREATLSYQGKEMQLVFNIDIDAALNLTHPVIDSPDLQEGAFELVLTSSVTKPGGRRVPNDHWKEVKRDYDPDALGVVSSNVAEGYKEARRAASVNDHEAAITLLKSLTDQAPDKALLWRELGDSYLEIRRYSESVASYGKALALDPNASGLTDRLASALFLTGNFKEAEQYAKDAADGEKRLGARAYYSLGLAKRVGVDRPLLEAEKAFRKAIELDDRFPDAYWQLSLTLLRSRSGLTEVLALLERFLALAPLRNIAEAQDLLIEVKREIEASPR